MTKKRLLITTDAFLPHWDGIARFLLEIIPGLKNDYDITIIAPKFEVQIPTIEGVKIVRMPLIKILVADKYGSLPKFGEFKEIVKNSDLIFNQTLGPIGMTAIRYGKRYKKPVISYIHIIEWELVPKSIKRGKVFAKVMAKWFTRYYYNRCNLLLVPTKEEADILKSNGIKTLKAVV
jgi:glycosyltransferase involved in cell wall biosynthesis